MLLLGTLSPGRPYRGRIAPSPTGHLHLGHAATFWTAFRRARDAEGTLILRVEDLDAARCRGKFVEAMFEDLRWFGLSWEEGPDIGGPRGPYKQSERRPLYIDAWQRLANAGFLYPCSCSRRDIQRSVRAPHAGDDEPVYSGACRSSNPKRDRAGVSWRFRVPDGKAISFFDHGQGEQTFVAGRDFGDFVVWRKDDVPAYQLAVVVDDHAMGITEVVRGADLLLSTARQILLYQALRLPAPEFYHCPLVTDSNGVRLAKRCHSLSLQTFRARGTSPENLRILLRNGKVPDKVR